MKNRKKIKMSFENKVVIVTGASSGIGAAFATKFAEEGAKVVLVGRNKQKLKAVSEKCGITGSKLVITADVTKEDDLRRIVDDTVRHFGQIDVLINNAGMNINTSIMSNNAMEIFDQVMATNLRSVVCLTHLASKYLIETKGNIINISSATARSVVIPGYFSYCTSKAAIDHFTRTVASELASKGVRVNSINPGPVRTNFIANRDLNEKEEEARWAYMGELTSLKRVSSPEEIADIGLFIASDKAAAITGAAFVSDNGFLIRPVVG